MLNQENRIGIVTIILHESGEYIESPPIFVKSPKQDAQGAGSVITYLRRYSLSSMFGITSEEDDDANDATLKNDLVNVLKEKEILLSTPAQELYKSVCTSLNIKKKTSELTDKETRAVISMLNKL